MEWLKEIHVPSLTEVLTMLGIGGGSGFLGKRWTDKEQNNKIKALETKVEKHEGMISDIATDQQQMKKDLETNTKFDKQNYTHINERLDKIDKKQDSLEETIDQKTQWILKEIIQIIKR